MHERRAAPKIASTLSSEPALQPASASRSWRSLPPDGFAFDPAPVADESH
jgi:hypothetical protein